jgi:hypothetical protein
MNAQKHSLAVVFLSLYIVLSASANQIQFGYAGSSFGEYQTGIGGEFTLVPVSPIGWLDLSGYSAAASGVGGVSSFQSFCLEYQEHIGAHGQYDAVQNTDAVWGGDNLGSDPLSVGTGWLYSEFALGTLSGYNYGVERSITASQLQNAIWMLEGEVAYNDSNPFVQLVTAPEQFGSWSAATNNGANMYGVFALNLTDPIGGRHQDQVYFIQKTVPDGGLTIILLGIALGVIGLVSRRLMK